MRKVRLIYKAEETYLKTSYPAYYYGSPDNKVYVVYSSSYLTPSGKSRLEFIIARHEQFSYNYPEGRLIEISTQKTPLLNSFVDNRNLILTTLKSFKNCKSYDDAEGLLNQLISQDPAKNVRKPGFKTINPKAD
jgi:hypothetical protein